MQAISFKSFCIPVVESEGRRWVSVRHVCEALGVDPDSQRVKLRKSSEYMCGDITSRDTIDRNQRIFCIAAEHAHLWIAGISSAKVSADIRDQFIAYKHKCANVVYNHFLSKGQDLLGISQQIALLAKSQREMHDKIDHLAGMSLTVFGNDAEEIKDLMNKTAIKFNLTHQDIWGIIRKECDVSSYKLQNRKIINFLKNMLGEGLRLVKEGDTQ